MSDQEVELLKIAGRIEERLMPYQEIILSQEDLLGKVNAIIVCFLENFPENFRDAEYIVALNIFIQENYSIEYSQDIEGFYDYVLEIKQQLEEDEEAVDVVEAPLAKGQEGFVYVLMNPSMTGIVKVGMTTREPEERIIELSGATGIPTPFILVYKEYFLDCLKAEKVIHEILEERGDRISKNREFFKTEISDIVDIIKEVKDSESLWAEDNHTYEDSYYATATLPLEYLEIGLSYKDGLGEYLQDYEKAIEYLEKAGGLGVAEAYYELGNMFIDTLLIDEITLDVKKAIFYFEKGKKLEGEFANRCNAGLALCYCNRHFSYINLKNYKINQVNASKCWEWYFKELDLNAIPTSLIIDVDRCLYHFLLNEDISNILRENLEIIFLPIVKKLRYKLFREEKFKTWNEELYNYLLEKFDECQLEREVEIKWLPKSDTTEENGEDFRIKVIRGNLRKEDILEFSTYQTAIRSISHIKKGPEEIDVLCEGEIARIYVSSILEDFGGFIFDNITFEVIGSDFLEEIKHEEIKENALPEIDNKYTVTEKSETETTKSMDSKKSLTQRLKEFFF